ncbi:MAG: GAF domain-containing protein [Bacteroidota bacterium]
MYSTESPFLPQISLGKFFAYYPTRVPEAGISSEVEALVKGESRALTEVDFYQDEMESLLAERLSSSWFKEEARAIVSPFPFVPLFRSARFREIVGPNEAVLNKFMEASRDSLYIFACGIILERHFGFPLMLKTPFLLSFPGENGLISSYRVDLIADLTDLEPLETAREISEEEYLLLMDNFEDIELWKQYFPPASWLITGVCVVQLIDITRETALSDINRSLLALAPDAMHIFQQAVRNLLWRGEAEMGFSVYEEGVIIGVPEPSNKTLFVQGTEEVPPSLYFEDPCIELLFQEKRPLVVSRVEGSEKGLKPYFLERLKRQNICSFVVLPLVFNGELLGFMEIRSSQPNAFNTSNIPMVNEFLPLLSMAVKQFHLEAANRLDAIIQQEFTSLHPSVKWKFMEQAREILYSSYKGEEAPEVTNIVLDSVYPFYGQLDVRNSSGLRNDALWEDLNEQAALIREILEKAAEREGNKFQRERMLLDVVLSKFTAETENAFLEFICTRIEPLLVRIASLDDALGELVGNYVQRLDPNTGTLYRARKRYDQSVDTINRQLAMLLDQRQEAAQKLFPHYFDRFKTDGVEFNLYIGQSITNAGEFREEYLAYLKLWHLVSVCELEMEFQQNRNQLAMDLEIASLIFVFNAKVDIVFRLDEKRFDARGAQNARYEVIKKRIDKARIKGTDERITQPGMLTLVYTSREEGREYRRFIDFLHDSGLVIGAVQEHELEDLPGVAGLKSLRVRVAAQVPEHRVTMEEVCHFIDHGQDKVASQALLA